MESVSEIARDCSEVSTSSSKDVSNEDSSLEGSFGCEISDSSNGESNFSSVSGIESDNEDQGQSQHPRAASLYPEAQLSTKEFDVAFMSLVQRHNLTYSSQTDVLKLFSIVLPSPSIIPTSSVNFLTMEMMLLLNITVVLVCLCCKQACCVLTVVAQRHSVLFL